MITIKVYKDGSNAMVGHVTVAHLPFKIGRSAEADLVLADERLSRIHCVVEQGAQGPVLKDQSRNGIYVASSRVMEHVLLAPVEVRVGTYRLFFDRAEAPAPSPTITPAATHVDPCPTPVVLVAMGACALAMGLALHTKPSQIILAQGLQVVGALVFALLPALLLRLNQGRYGYWGFVRLWVACGNFASVLQAIEKSWWFLRLESGSVKTILGALMMTYLAGVGTWFIRVIWIRSEVGARQMRAAFVALGIILPGFYALSVTSPEGGRRLASPVFAEQQTLTWVPADSTQPTMTPGDFTEKLSGAFDELDAEMNNAKKP